MRPIASICIVCPDRPGIVAAVTAFLFTHHGNIIALEEHTEDGYFFMRIEWELLMFDLTGEKEFLREFAPLRDQFSMHIRLDFLGSRKRVGLMCSRELHCLIDILGRQLIGELDIIVPYVIGNYEEARDTAEKFGVKFFYVTTSGDRASYEKQLLEIIRTHESDVIGLARFMKVLSPDFIEACGQPIINVHHSFLPSFVGAKPYEDAYDRGVKIIGATAHFVIPELDQGPIVEQRVKTIRHNHKIDNLKLIGRECEKEAFAFALRKHIENKLIIFKRRVIVFE